MKSAGGDVGLSPLANRGGVAPRPSLTDRVRVGNLNQLLDKRNGSSQRWGRI